ncbi:TetR family transcriptional regulator [Thalassospira profundimaris]|uniref:TetR family transcriptional regulator n=1 Tax=Thalassospira profundimaris TaxID=502049 RepID=A0A367WFF9_9PROT|nr:TetR/AcrR family transcriptional regulator [Thalassospira profundimaris]RCK40173.1 TetR family transcriptional regulator [Thalassospira profundimaris]
MSSEHPREPDGSDTKNRARRTDAKRSFDALVQAAREVFASSGVDAPVRDIAGKAGVGTGTLYRHFPKRGELIAAVFRNEVDACADAAPALAEKHQPFEALAAWLHRFSEFIAAKRGLASALHSGDPAFETLPAYFDARLRPVLSQLLERAAKAGEIRSDIDADDIISAVANLSMPAKTARPDHTRRVVDIFINGLKSK